ncbi:spondin domain-containing protein [Polaribacter sp.]|nr:spondin domain-containing protein [Polaribacter sp.]
MQKIELYTLLMLSFLFVQCNETDEKESSPVASKVTYKVTFEFNWNNKEFPIDYPSNAHFSKLIGWSHTSTNNFFLIETMAFEGIKDMAELGATSTLENELNEKIVNGDGLDFVIGENLSGGVGEITVDIIVNKENSSVTLATMIAPSPDWYVGVVNINLFENGEFTNEKIVDGLIYDAGTDSGTSFTSNNAETKPKQPISFITNLPLGNGITISTVKFSKQ